MKQITQFYLGGGSPTLKRCIPLMRYAVAKLREKFAFQKIKTKPRHAL